MVTASRVLACAVALATLVAPAWADGESLRASVVRVDAAQPPARDVYISVSDSRGQPVTGLSRDAFALTEDGASVPIDRVALANDSQQAIAFGLLMDVSGSMN